MYRGLIISNSRFPDDPALNDLNGPDADAILLAAGLTHHRSGMFDRADLRMLRDETAHTIIAEVERFFTSAAPDDTLLLYYSGHGRGGRRNLFLCARDTVTTQLHATAISGDVLSGIIAECYAQSVVIVLDCCYSGMFKGEMFTADLGTGRYVIAASSSTTRASDSTAPGSPSPFTAALVRGLEEEAPDRNADGWVDLDDLYEYLCRVELDGPRPERTWAGAGAVPIARREVAGSVTAEVPTEMPPPSVGDYLDAPAGTASYSIPRIAAFRSDIKPDLLDVLPASMTDGDFLDAAGLRRDGVLTLAGVLLFGRNPAATIPTAIARCVRFFGATKDSPLETVTFRGSIPEMIVSCRDFVSDVARRGEAPTATSAFAQPSYAYPMLAVREIIANAFVHRDYRSTDACVQIHAYTDRIEVMSPGRWSTGDGEPELVNIGALARPSRPPNFRLADAIGWLKLVEGVGAGVIRAVADSGRLGAPEPMVTQHDDLVTVTIYPVPVPTGDTRDPRSDVPIGALTRVTVNLNPRAVHALDQVAAAGGFTKTDTINRALQVYALIEELMDRDGGVLRVQKPNGDIERIQIV